MPRASYVKPCGSVPVWPSRLITVTSAEYETNDGVAQYPGASHRSSPAETYASPPQAWPSSSTIESTKNPEPVRVMRVPASPAALGEMASTVGGARYR